MNFIFPVMVYPIPLKRDCWMFFSPGFSLKQLQKNLIENPT